MHDFIKLTSYKSDKEVYYIRISTIAAFYRSADDAFTEVALINGGHCQVTESVDYIKSILGIEEN